MDGGGKLATENDLKDRVMLSTETKHELSKLKCPGERLGDVVARLVKEHKRNDYISEVLRIAKEGEFVRLDSDAEYAQIRKELLSDGHRDKTRRVKVPQ